jgi:hypothetical protein
MAAALRCRLFSALYQYSVPSVIRNNQIGKNLEGNVCDQPIYRTGLLRGVTEENHEDY